MNMDTLLQDLRYAARTLRRSPGFTLAALLTLALGIGANTAIFSLVDGIVLRALAYDEPERVVRILESHREHGIGDGTVSYGNFLDWREQAGVFEGIAAYDGWRPTLTGDGDAELLGGAAVSANFFDVLGVRPALGRFFLADEDAPGAATTVILGHGLWTRRFGADPGVLGRTIELSGTPYTVVGVAPPDFEDPMLSRGSRVEPQIWRPTPGHWPGLADDRRMRGVTAVGRLRAGVPIERARTGMEALAGRLADAYPDANRDWTVRLEPLKERIVAPVRPALLLLLGAVGLVLLIACANVANLLLARAAGRGREVAVRAALGASRGRIVRQLLTESLLLALAGGAAGAFLAWQATGIFAAVGAGDLPRIAGVTIDSRVLGFAAAASLATGLLFGLAPALHAAAADLRAPLAEGGRGRSGGRRPRRLREALVTAEVALATVLLVGAGLLLLSLGRLLAVDPGFRPEGTLTAAVSLPRHYQSETRVRQAYDDILGRLAVLPGVEAVGYVNILPMSGGYWRTGFGIDDQPPPDRPPAPNAEFRAASPDAFRALGIPLLRGRGFNERDAAGAPPVVVVNEALATLYFPGQDPVGHRLNFQDGPREVIGVAGAVREFGLDRPAEPAVYLPLAQAPFWLTGNGVLMARAAVPPATLAPALRAAVRGVDPAIPIASLRTMDAVLGETTAAQRFRTLLLTFFAGTALLLGAVGIYGVISCTVAERRFELGVRLALGASTAGILRLVLHDGMRPVALGLALGLAGATAAGRLLAGFLYGTSGADPVAFIATLALLAATAAAACWIPARRAARVDPVMALRTE